MEEFRQPLVDSVVLSLIGRGTRLELNSQGDLTSRTRTLAQKAFARALERRTSASVTMLQVIRQQARSLARALANGTAYEPYRYIW
jgi:CRISPR-associated protein Cas1